MGATPFPGTLAQQVPQQPQQQGPQDMNAELLQGSQQARQMLAEQVQRVRALSDQAAALRQQQASLQVPKMGYQPNFQPMDSFGHVMGDIGKGLLLGLASTGPGQRVQGAMYGPGIQEYKAKSGSLAQQIQEIQGQQKTEEETLPALSQAIYHPYMAAGQYMRGQAAMMNAQSEGVYKQHMAKVQDESNRIKADLGAKKITEEQARTRMMQVIGQERNAAMVEAAGLHADATEGSAQMRAVEQQFSTESNHLLEYVFGAPTPPTITPNQPNHKVKPSGGGGGVVTHIFVPGQGLKAAGDATKPSQP